MVCAVRLALCLRRGEQRPRAFDWTLDFASKWQGNRNYAAGVRIRPNAQPQRGVEWESGGGQSNGQAEPKWPKAEDTVAGVTTVDDGSITWTARALSNASLIERIVSHAWPAVTGYTLTPGAFTDEPGRQETPAQIQADPAAVDAEIVCQVTTNLGNKYHAIIDVTIDNAT